jgi:hypothetical protein
MAKARYVRSRWDSVPLVRDVRNTDGDVLRKAEIRPAVFMAKTTTLQFRRGGRVEGGRLIGGHHVRRPEYYAEGADSQCLCRVAGSERCPVSGHAKRRDIPAPAAWSAVEHPSGARLVKNPKVSER